MLRRISSIILYVCLYLHWGLFKMGWVFKKSVFSFFNALISTKLHSCSKPIYFTINIYYFQYPPQHLKIRPLLRGVLGRISVLIIESLKVAVDWKRKTRSIYWSMKKKKKKKKKQRTLHLFDSSFSCNLCSIYSCMFIPHPLYFIMSHVLRKDNGRIDVG